MKTKKLAACSSLGQLLLWLFLHRNLEGCKSGVDLVDQLEELRSAKLKLSAQGMSRRTCVMDLYPGGFQPSCITQAWVLWTLYH